MTFRKLLFSSSKKLVVPEQLVNSLQDDIVCDRLFLTALSYSIAEDFSTISRRSEPQDNVLIYMRQGRGSLTVYGNYKRFNAGQYFVVPAGEEFAFNPSRGESCELVTVNFRGKMTEEVSKRSLRHAVSLVGSDRRELERLLLQLFNCIDKDVDVDAMRYSTLILGYILGNMFYGNHAITDETSAQTSPSNLAIEVAIRYMREHLEQRIRLEDVSAHAGYMPTYFSSLFRRKTGYSPIAYFNIMKMQRACELLVTTRMRILDICAQLGIEDNYYFSRLFSKTIGMSPKMYRKTHT